MINIKATISEEDLQKFYEETGEVLDPIINLTYDNDITKEYSIYLVNGYRVILNDIVITQEGKVTKGTVNRMFVEDNPNG